MNKTYSIELKDGAKYTGTAEDIARFYCKHNGIRLYTGYNENGGNEIGEKIILIAERYNKNVPDGDEVFHVSSFKGFFFTDFETGYYLFFTDYLAKPEIMKEEGYTLTQIEK